MPVKNAAAGNNTMIVVAQSCGCGMQAVIPMEKLRDFIAFARARCDPELTDEAGQDLVSAYKSMRSQGTSRKCITATPRQLESMIRLSEALARMRLSPCVERHDVAEAVRLMKVASVQIAHELPGAYIGLCSLYMLLPCTSKSFCKCSVAFSLEVVASAS